MNLLKFQKNLLNEWKKIGERLQKAKKHENKFKNIIIPKNDKIKLIKGSIEKQKKIIWKNLNL